MIPSIATLYDVAGGNVGSIRLKRDGDAVRHHASVTFGFDAVALDAADLRYWPGLTVPRTSPLPSELAAEVPEA